MYSFRKEVVKAMSERAETYLCAPTDFKTDYWKDNGCRFIPCNFDRHGMDPFKELWHIFFYKKLLRKIKPDLVFTYTIKPNVYAGMACASLGIPYVPNITGLGDSIENGGWLQKTSLILYKFALRKAECVFFQNNTNHQFFLNKKIVKSSNSRRIPGSGVNLEVHNFEEYPESTSSNEIRFLFIARITKDKGIEELLQAIHVVRQKYPNCILEILGHCENEQYLPMLREAEALGDIRYYGQQIDVHRYYKNCHCVILPSYHEGTSNVLLEGAATGRPLIATRVPGCQEIFNEGINGFGCRVKDVYSLVETMKKFILISPEQKKKMGKASRKKIEEEFNRDIVVKAYLDEFEEILRHKHEYGNDIG